MEYGVLFRLLLIICTGFYVGNWKNTRLMFCFFLFAASGIGQYYNEELQIGGVIVPADLFLCGFLGSWFFFSLRQEIRIKQKTLVIALIFIAMLLMGITEMNALGNILRDVKVFVYFFAAYLYLKDYAKDETLQRYLFYTLLGMILFAIGVCGYDFFSYGLQGIETGKIDRTFGLGISQYGLAIAVVILSAAIQYIQGVWRKTICYTLICIGILLCIVSYTRSVWLQLIVSLVLYFIVYFIYAKKSVRQLGRLLIKMLVIVCIMTWIVYKLAAQYPEISNLILDRFHSININMEFEGNSNTLQYRMQEVNDFVQGKFKSVRVFVGYGFGDMLEGKVSTIAENSFVYYIWKYGAFLSCYLFYLILKKFYTIMRRRTLISMAVVISTSVYFFSGGMSGHLNKYYMLPLMAVLLECNIEHIVQAHYKKRDEEEERMTWSVM